ncbi:MAG: hypothetical protein M1828_007364 [Chrysothrix sp. TS-e1954]|nr:MAG: hypothetical protein M1828_007364 [Chrysothrix sp. TS-e1954]
MELPQIVTTDAFGHTVALNYVAPGSALTFTDNFANVQTTTYQSLPYKSGSVEAIFSYNWCLWGNVYSNGPLNYQGTTCQTTHFNCYCDNADFKKDVVECVHDSSESRAQANRVLNYADAQCNGPDSVFGPASVTSEQDGSTITIGSSGSDGSTITIASSGIGGSTITSSSSGADGTSFPQPTPTRTSLLRGSTTTMSTTTTSPPLNQVPAPQLGSSSLSSPLSSQPSSSHHRANGLSGGAIVGIGVGAGVAGIILLALLLGLFLHLRARRTTPPQQHDSSMEQPIKRNPSSWRGPHPLDGMGVHWFPAGVARHEPGETRTKHPSQPPIYDEAVAMAKVQR